MMMDCYVMFVTMVSFLDEGANGEVDESMKQTQFYPVCNVLSICLNYTYTYTKLSSDRAKAQ